MPRGIEVLHSESPPNRAREEAKPNRRFLTGAVRFFLHMIPFLASGSAAIWESLL
jgi:hypothetical protein